MLKEGSKSYVLISILKVRWEKEEWKTSKIRNVFWSNIVCEFMKKEMLKEGSKSYVGVSIYIKKREKGIVKN